jgi:hypothetical protein
MQCVRPAGTGTRIGEETEMPGSYHKDPQAVSRDLEREGYSAYRKLFEDTDDTRRA